MGVNLTIQEIKKIVDDTSGIYASYRMGGESVGESIKARDEQLIRTLRELHLSTLADDMEQKIVKGD